MLVWTLVNFSARNERISDPAPSSSGLFGSPETMRGKAMRRALGAIGGLYGIEEDEALYETYTLDTSGERLDASRRDYVIRFPGGVLPPAGLFWSITMYNGDKFLSENPLGRYLINSAIAHELKAEPNGDIVIHLQHDSPGAALESNWLPADGLMGVVLPIYLPEAAGPGRDVYRPVDRAERWLRRVVTSCSRLAALLATPMPALAEETRAGHNVPGGAATLTDLPPTKPGFIVQGLGLYYDGEILVSRNFPIAGTIAAGLEARADAATFGALYTLEQRVPVRGNGSSGRADARCPEKVAASVRAYARDTVVPDRDGASSLFPLL